MSDGDAAERRREAAGWLAIAREDVRVARACLALDPPARGVAAYHCQQAAEKLTKGLLVAASTAFRKTHDLDELADLAGSHYPECRDLLDALRPLTVWGVAYRYPGAEDISEPVPDEPELRRTIDLIERLGEQLQAAVVAGDSPSSTLMAAMRRLAAILAADVAGYSRLMGADEEGTLERLKALCRELVDPKIAEYRGRIVKTTGDGLLVEFASVVDAVRCAVAVQQAMPERNTSVAADDRIELRIGINLGDVIVEGDDLYGDGVNIAARIEALADAGGVFVSNTVHDHVRDRLPFVFEDLGEQQVKNIARPVRVYRVSDAGATTKSPSAPALPLPDKPSIAVLPFANMSGDPEQEYFADGMVEEIITALSKIRWFFVIARNSSFTYKGRAIDVKQVGRELGVRYVLEGSMRKGGNRVRITAQLIEAGTGNHIWAERYDRELADIFAVQDDITERVVATLEPELYAAEYFRSQRKPPESLDAWECVIRALSHVSEGTLDGNAQAEALCRRALLIAPRYSQARSLLAWVLLRGHQPRLQEALTESIAAPSFDERDAWAHLTHGIALWRMRRHGEAEQAFRRALDFNPNFALALAFLGCPLAVRGANEEAVRSAERALRLSPADGLVSAYASFAMVFAHFGAARYADGVVWARKLIDKQPENLVANYLLVAASAMQEDSAAAEEALASLRLLQPDFSLSWVSGSTPLIGEVADRVLEGLQKAGVPER